MSGLWLNWPLPIGSMYAIYGNIIYHQYTPNVTIYGIHGSYGLGRSKFEMRIGKNVIDRNDTKLAGSILQISKYHVFVINTHWKNVMAQLKQLAASRTLVLSGDSNSKR